MVSVRSASCVSICDGIFTWIILYWFCLAGFAYNFLFCTVFLLTRRIIHVNSNLQIFWNLWLESHIESSHCLSPTCRNSFSFFFFLLFFSSALFKVFLLPSCHLSFTTVNICVPRLAVFDQWQQFKKCWRLIALSNSSSKMLWNEFSWVWMEIPDCESEGIDLDSNMEVHKRWK